MFSLYSDLTKAKNLTKQIIATYKKVHTLTKSRDKLLESLALSGKQSSLNTLFTLISENHFSKNIPLLAEQIAKSYDLKTICMVAEKYSREDVDRYVQDTHKLVTLITQELILCGKDPRTTVLEKIYNKYIGRGKILQFNVLPLQLFDIEKDKLAHETASTKQKASKTLPHQVKSLSTKESILMKSAVAHWQEESNGYIEIKLFELDKPINSDVLPNVLGNLELESLPNGEEYMIGHIPFKEIYAHLFWAATQGGAYSDGYHGAKGRLSTWESLAGLVGAENPDDIESIYKTAQKCEWFFFTGTSWFSDIAWDLGIVCLREDKKTIAVLAASDVD